MCSNKRPWDRPQDGDHPGAPDDHTRAAYMASQADFNDSLRGLDSKSRMSLCVTNGDRSDERYSTALGRYGDT